MSILTAHDVSVSLGQWMPYALHYYGYYFVGISVLIIVIVYQSSELIAVRISRRTTFNSFMVNNV